MCVGAYHRAQLSQPGEAAYMSLSKVPTGHNVPDNINVTIEIPAHSDPVKYEVDKESGAVCVDRFVSTTMFYPCNYGYIPNAVRRW